MQETSAESSWRWKCRFAVLLETSLLPNRKTTEQRRVRAVGSPAPARAASGRGRRSDQSQGRMSLAGRSPSAPQAHTVRGVGIGSLPPVPTRPLPLGAVSLGQVPVTDGQRILIAVRGPAVRLVVRAPLRHRQDPTNAQPSQPHRSGSEHPPHHLSLRKRVQLVASAIRTPGDRSRDREQKRTAH